MNLIRSLTDSFKRFSGLNPNQTALLNRYVQNWDQTDNIGGNNVSIRSGLHQDTIFTAIKRIADTVAMTPCGVFKHDDATNGRDKLRQHPVYRVLNQKANLDLTGYGFKQLATTHLLGWGNSFSEIERNGKGEILALNPMCPDDVKIAGRAMDGTLVYEWTNKTGQKFLMRSRDVLHIKGISFDGIVGVSVITQLRSLVGRTANREEFSSRFYANGTMMSGILSIPSGLTDEQLERHRQSFTAMYSGARNSGKILLLEGESTYNPLGISQKDAEFVATSQLDQGKLAAAFGVPSFMLNDTSNINRGSAETMFREFLMLGLNTIFSNIEAEINVGLFSDVEQKTMYCEFNRESLIQSDFEVMVKGLRDQVNTAMLTPNEARARMNMNPLDGGDDLICGVNMVPLKRLGQPHPSMIPATAEPPTTPQDESPAPEPPMRSTRALHPVRKRSKGARAGLVKSSKPLLKDAFDRIGKRESQDVAAAAKKLGTGEDFSTWLTNYYAKDSAFSKFFEKTITPILDSLTTGVKNSVEDQLETDIEDDGSEFAGEYLDTLLWRYTSSSESQLNDVLANVPDGEEPIKAIQKRLDEWSDGIDDESPSKSEKASENESNRFVNAMARTMMGFAGVTKLVWTANDDACPICEELDGKVVGIDESFAEDGQELANGFKNEGSLMHSPLHQGCSCTVEPQ